MQFNHFTTIAVAAFFTMSQAFTLPEGITDGIYVSQRDASGNFVTEYLGPLNSTGEVKRRTTAPHMANLAARDQSGCTAVALDHGDCDAAVSALESYCNSGTHYSSAVMSFVSGSVLAYSCDYTGDQLCYSAEAVLAYEEITAKCGLYQSGWWLFSGDNKNYGYDSVTASICANI